MKSNQVSVLVVLLLCLVMGGFLYVVDRSSDDEKGWTPSELYSELGARSYEGSSFSDVTFSGGASSDGVAVSMRNGSFSLRTRARHASSPPRLIAPSPSSPIALSPNSPIANGVPGKSADFWGAFSPNSLIGHMTSSAEFHSFGGGSNMAMGSYTSSSNGLIASSPAIGSYSPSPSSPIALSPNSLITSSPNNLIAYSPSNSEVQVSAEQALMSASSSASGLFSGMMTSYGTASYGDYAMYGSYGSTPSGVRGRQNAGPGSSAYNSWLEWLLSYGQGEGWTGTSWDFDNEGAYNAFLAWFLDTYGQDYDPENPTGGLGVPVITYEQWLSWFTSNGGTHEYDGYHFNFTPVGNILPLLLMAFLYMIILFVKRNKTAQL